MAVSVNWGPFCACVYKKSPTIGVCIRVPDLWKLPRGRDLSLSLLQEASRLQWQDRSAVMLEVLG